MSTAKNGCVNTFMLITLKHNPTLMRFMCFQCAPIPSLKLIENKIKTKMLWKLLGRYTPNLRSGSELFGSLKSPLFSSHHFQCAVRTNETVEQWIKTLAEDKQKRLRHIQSEVSINLAECFLFACFSFI